MSHYDLVFSVINSANVNSLLRIGLIQLLIKWFIFYCEIWLISVSLDLQKTVSNFDTQKNFLKYYMTFNKLIRFWWHLKIFQNKVQTSTVSY